MLRNFGTCIRSQVSLARLSGLLAIYKSFVSNSWHHLNETSTACFPDVFVLLRVLIAELSEARALSLSSQSDAVRLLVEASVSGAEF